MAPCGTRCRDCRVRNSRSPSARIGLTRSAVDRASDAARLKAPPRPRASPMMSVTSSSVLFLLLDEGGIVEALVDLDVVVVALDDFASPASCPAPRRRRPRARRIRPPGSPAPRPPPGARRRRARGGRRLRPRPRGQRRQRHRRVSHFGQTIGSCSGRRTSRRNSRRGAWCRARVLPRSGFLERVRKLRCFTWRVATALSIARRRPRGRGAACARPRPSGRRARRG